MKPLRLFIGVPVPKAIHSKVQAYTDTARVHGRAVNWVNHDTLHCTLKFLGETHPALLPRIISHLERVGAQFAPFELEVRGGNGFPALKRPNVFWVGVGGDVKTAAAAAHMTDALISSDFIGFSPDPAQKYVPHITVARAKAPPTNPAVSRVISLLNQLNGATDYTTDRPVSAADRASILGYDDGAAAASAATPTDAPDTPFAAAPPNGSFGTFTASTMVVYLSEPGGVYTIIATIPFTGKADPKTATAVTTWAKVLMAASRAGSPTITATGPCATAGAGSVPPPPSPLKTRLLPAAEALSPPMTADGTAACLAAWASFVASLPRASATLSYTLEVAAAVAAAGVWDEATGRGASGGGYGAKPNPPRPVPRAGPSPSGSPSEVHASPTAAADVPPPRAPRGTGRRVFAQGPSRRAPKEHV